MIKFNLKQFGIDIRNFDKGERIGKGGFSEVYLAEYKKSGINYAAKVLKNSIFKEEEKTKIENEIDILSSIDHPTIIKYLGYSLLDFCLSPNIVIFTEYAKRGSLNEIIHQAKRSKPPEDYDNTSRQIILIGVSCGMKYLHNRNIMHRDLKTNNILLDENYHPHITDFGMAKYVQKNKLFEQTPLCGTLPYMAPEMFLGKKYSYKIDVYSFGILMYEVICESDLYPHITNKDSLTKEFKEYVAVSNNRPEFKKEVKNSIKRLIQKCWAPEIKDRPTFDEIYEKLIKPEYYLDNVDEDKIKDYIEKITQNDSYSNFQLIEKVRELSKENKKLRDQIHVLKRDNQKLSKMLDEVTQNNSKIVIKPPILNDENFLVNSPRIHHLKEKDPIFALDDDKKFLTPQKQPKTDDFKNLQKKSDIEISPAPKIRFLRPKEDEIQLLKPKNDEVEISPLKPIKFIQKKDDEIQFLRQKEKKNDEVENSPLRPINNQHMLTSSPRRLPHFARLPLSNEKKEDDRPKDDENAQKKLVNEEVAIKLPSLIKSKKSQFNPNNFGILLSEFNSLSLHHQLQVIKSRIISINPALKSDKNKLQFFKNVFKLLNYLIHLINSPETAFYFFEIHPQNEDEKFESVCEMSSITVLSNTTEMLYEKDLLDTDEFYEIAKVFKHVLFEVKYLSKIYRGIYNCVLTMKKVKIQLFITGMKKTDNTFKGNKNIKSVRFDNTVDYISDYAFKDCLSLKKVFFQSSIKTIGSGSFEGCYSLLSVSIPSSVTSIGFSVFKGCSDLKEVFMCNSIKLIRSNTFYGCSSLQKFSIPASVSSIGDYAFFDCSSLEVVNIPSSVVSIGEFAFSQCSALKQISIPSSVSSIGKCAFRGCKSLEKIVIPASIKNLNELDIITGCTIVIV